MSRPGTFLHGRKHWSRGPLQFVREDLGRRVLAHLFLFGQFEASNHTNIQGLTVLDRNKRVRTNPAIATRLFPPKCKPKKTGVRLGIPSSTASPHFLTPHSTASVLSSSECTLVHASTQSDLTQQTGKEVARSVWLPNRGNGGVPMYPFA